MLNNLGRLVYLEWLRTSEIRNNVIIDEFIIMPDHLHGIIMILDRSCKGVSQYALTGRKLVSPSETLGSIVRGFKSLTTKKINLVRDTPGVPVWQRNYYDRVIRNERELDNIRQYIYENPAKWSFSHEKNHELFISLTYQNH